MKDDETLHTLEYIDADLIEAADALPQKKTTWPYWFAAVAAILVLVIALPILLGGIGIPDGPQLGSVSTNSSTESSLSENVPTTGQPQVPVLVPLSNRLAEPKYPEMMACPNYDDYSNHNDYYQDYTAWRENQNRQYDQPSGYADSLTTFFHTSIAEFLQGNGNPTYSPVNLYLAMAMLAETADGNSRQQILDLFGLDTIEQLREQASYMWNAHYCDDKQTSLLLANSLWLDDAYDFNQATADLLAERYYASAFRGDLGTEETNQQLQSWLYQNTGGLLGEQAENVQLSPETVFALASTVYFTASWETEFSENKTQEAIFHSPEGDRNVPFMNRTLYQHSCYWGENFTAIYLPLSGNNNMWLILPDEGHTVAEILESEEYLKMTMRPSDWKNQKIYEINLRLPKFDVADQKDLIEGMKAMGVTDIFDYNASDFSPITDTPQLYVSKIDHAARVAIDETGCFGAAFTVLDFPNSAAPTQPEKIDFVLDRPFLFVVSSRDQLPLFAGVVNAP